jgi:glucarate dehydratase
MHFTARQLADAYRARFIINVLYQAEVVMRITEVKAITVSVPFQYPLSSTFGTRLGTTRTLLRIDTDAGYEGWGEVHGGVLTRTRLEHVAPLVLHADPFEWESRVNVLRWYGSEICAAYEMALLDLIGRASNRSVAELLGGKKRTAIDYAGYAFFRTPNGNSREIVMATELLELCTGLVADYGFRVLKIKTGVGAPEWEVEVAEEIRRKLPRVKLRLDPNSSWKVSRTMAMIKKLDALGLEYLEDPCAGLRNLAIVADNLRTPVATDTWIVKVEDLMASVQMGACDVLMGDMERWGGLRVVQQAAGLASSLGLGVTLHSWGQLGVATAAQLHLASATPTIDYALDSHYHHQSDDIITQPFTAGQFQVPQGSGLGVTVDPNKVAQYHEMYLRFEAETLSLRDGFIPDIDDPCRRHWRPLASQRLK